MFLRVAGVAVLISLACAQGSFFGDVNDLTVNLLASKAEDCGLCYGYGDTPTELSQCRSYATTKFLYYRCDKSTPTPGWCPDRATMIEGLETARQGIESIGNSVGGFDEDSFQYQSCSFFHESFVSEDSDPFSMGGDNLADTVSKDVEDFFEEELGDDIDDGDVNVTTIYAKIRTKNIDDSFDYPDYVRMVSAPSLFKGINGNCPECPYSETNGSSVYPVVDRESRDGSLLFAPTSRLMLPVVVRGLGKQGRPVGTKVVINGRNREQVVNKAVRLFKENAKYKKIYKGKLNVRRRKNGQVVIIANYATAFKKFYLQVRQKHIFTNE